MKYYSTRSKTEAVSFSSAALAGLAPDGGLYVPSEIPQYPSAVKTSLKTMSFKDITYETILPWVKDDIKNTDLEDMIHSAYPFDAPVNETGDRFVLELFHGPTAAFKDFGARFMARAFSYLRRGEDKPLKILVATSGDTGGAVADGFFNIEGISVTVLYPKGRVSPLQERQIAGLGNNISALAVEGCFDDCQRLVKQIFQDEEFGRFHNLTSANSINISRLIPQASYYASSAGQLPSSVICVPSGNFGNLTAGLYAYKMGAPINKFIAATNINKTIPEFLESGVYKTRESQITLSNAMDVGAPSNYERMAAHFTLEEMRRLILGTSVSDEETLRTIENVYSMYFYILDPHTAVAWKAADKLKMDGKLSGNNNLIIVSTAHPAKFAETVEPITGSVPLPPSLENVMERKVIAKTIPVELEALRECI